METSLFELRSCDRKYRKKVRALFRSNYDSDALMVLKLSRVVWFADGNELLGSIAYKIHEGNIHVTSLIIHPDHRSQGFGSMMLKRFIEFVSIRRTKSTMITLFVDTTNPIALQLYRKFGFDVLYDTTDKNDMGHYHFMVLMTKTLPLKELS